MTTTQTQPSHLTAAHLLKDDHPLFKVFMAYCGNKQPTKRLARKFLQLPKYAVYRTIKPATK